MAFTSAKMDQYMGNGWVNSDPVYLTVGQGNREFIIHEDLLDNLSPLLGKEVTVTDSTSRKRIHLPTDDPATAARMVEFAYTGDFAAPGFVKIDPEQAVNKAHYDNPLQTVPEFGDNEVLIREWERFVSTGMQHNETLVHYDVAYARGHGRGLCAIAKVFGLAYTYDMEELQTLCLNKLHRLFVHHRQNTDLVDLLEQCANDDDCPMELFEFAVLCATLIADMITDQEGFRELLDEHANLAAAMFWCHADIFRKGTNKP